MITAALLKDLAYFYANTDRRTLEQVGLVSDDDRWQRFQHNFDIFILKLSDENRQVLADLANAHLRPGVQDAPPPIDIPEDIKPKVDEITAKYRFAAMTITEELLDTGLPEYICSNIAVFNVISQAARLAVMSAHAFEKREPRRDWWQVSTLGHFDEAVRWFAETLGKEMQKEAADEASSRDADFNEYRCVACDEVIEEGDLVYIENGEGGFIHAACCGPERDSYVDMDGNPLKPGDPLPEPFPFSSEVPDAKAEGGDGNG